MQNNLIKSTESVLKEKEIQTLLQCSVKTLHFYLWKLSGHPAWQQWYEIFSHLDLKWMQKENSTLLAVENFQLFFDF